MGGEYWEGGSSEGSVFSDLTGTGRGRDSGQERTSVNQLVIQSCPYPIKILIDAKYCINRITLVSILNLLFLSTIQGEYIPYCT